MPQELGRVFATPAEVMPTDDVATIIAKLRMKLQYVEDLLATTKKWGEAGWKRWSILRAAIDEASKVEQESAFERR